MRLLCKSFSVPSTKELTFSSPPPLVTKYLQYEKIPPRNTFLSLKVHFSFILGATGFIDDHEFYSVKKHFICLNGFRNSLTIRQPMLRVCKTFGLKDTKKRPRKYANEIHISLHILQKPQLRYATGYFYTSSILEA